MAWAASLGHVKVVRTLLRYGADIHISAGATFYHVYADARAEVLDELLLEFDADGFPCLGTCLKRGGEGCFHDALARFNDHVHYLLQSKGPLETKALMYRHIISHTSSKFTIRDEAVPPEFRSESFEIFQKIVYGKSVDAFLKALNRIRLLVSRHEYENAIMAEALVWAARLDHYEQLKYLVKVQRIDVQVFDNQALAWASRHAGIEVVKMLLKAGANPAARHFE